MVKYDDSLESYINREKKRHNQAHDDDADRSDRGDQRSEENGTVNVPDPGNVEKPAVFKEDSGTGKKIGFVIVIIIGVMWLISALDEPTVSSPSTTTSTQSPPRSQPRTTTQPGPAVGNIQASQSDTLQYTKPSVGTNNVLSVSAIRWCVREGFRIDAMRPILVTNRGIDAFNRFVSDYNSRCASFRYNQGHLQRAEREVGAFKIQITTEARNYARTLDGSSSASGSSRNNDTASSLLIREAQNLLNDLGYSSGVADGIYGPRTASAVRSFQRDTGILQDGHINQQLIERLKRSLGR